MIEQIAERPLSLVGVLIGTLLLYHGYQCIYNVLFHPLRNYPGPLLGRMSTLYSSYYRFIGRYPQHMSQLHDQHGPVVRIAPSELSYTSANAWTDICGYRPSNDKQQRPEFPKDPSGLGFQPDNAVNILFAAKDNHRRMRRIVAHAFSEKALWAQEPVLQSYADMLIEQLRSRTTDAGQKPLDLLAWLNFTTFDVIGDLMYGESFHCLETGVQHPWISFMFSAVKFVSFAKIALRMPIYLRPLCFLLCLFLLPNNMRAQKDRSQVKTRERVAKGITERRDFVDEMLRNDTNRWMTNEEIEATSNSMVIGGSETTATLLSGCMYLLAANPACMNRLAREIDGAFHDESEITLKALARLEYLQAVLQESLRVYAPVSDTLPRVVLEPGYTIDGRFVPGGTIAGVQQYAAYHTARNFHDPDAFRPERWLDTQAPEFCNDNRAALQPFSVGPRDCIGRNLAWAEMRLVVAKLLWNFTVELLPESRAWLDQRNYILWQRPPLMVRLSARSR